MQNAYQRLTDVWLAAGDPDTPPELADLLAWCADRIERLTEVAVLAEPSAGHPAYPYVARTWEGQWL